MNMQSHYLKHYLISREDSMEYRSNFTNPYQQNYVLTDQDNRSNKYIRQSQCYNIYNPQTGQYESVCESGIVLKPYQSYNFLGDYDYRKNTKPKYLNLNSIFIKNTIQLFNKCGFELDKTYCKIIVTAFIRSLEIAYDITIEGCEEFNRLDMLIDALRSDNFIKQFESQTKYMDLEIVKGYSKTLAALIISSILSYILKPKHQIDIFSQYK